MNKAQQEALKFLRGVWDYVSDPVDEIGWPGCYIVQVWRASWYESDERDKRILREPPRRTMTIGIREDGSRGS